MENNKIIWVSGAGSGIGLALAETLAEQGHSLALSAGHRDPIVVLARRFPDRVLALPGRLDDPFLAQNQMEIVAERFDRIDSVVVNGGTCEYLPMGRFNPSMVNDLITTNRNIGQRVVELALPLLRKAAAPHIIALCSPMSCLPEDQGNGHARGWLGQLRDRLKAEGIASTLIGPPSFTAELDEEAEIVMPRHWDAREAAAWMLERASQDIRFVPFAPMNVDVLWPLTQAN